MIRRRTFLKSGAVCSGAVAMTAGAKLEGETSNPSGVGGYDYRLPEIAHGSRLLFQGDSITDMKWGRNQNDRNH